MVSQASPFIFHIARRLCSIKNSCFRKQAVAQRRYPLAPAGFRLSFSVNWTGPACSRLFPSIILRSDQLHFPDLESGNGLTVHCLTIRHVHLKYDWIRTSISTCCSNHLSYPFICDGRGIWTLDRQVLDKMHKSSSILQPKGSNTMKPYRDFHQVFCLPILSRWWRDLNPQPPGRQPGILHWTTPPLIREL